MKKITFLIILFLTINLPATSLIAEEDKEIKNHPGYVNFDEIEIPGDAEETVEVYVKGPLLKLIARATEDEDPGLADILSKLLMIRVNTFSIDRDLADKLKPKINKIEDRLKDQKWEKVVRVKDRDDLVNIFIKLDNQDRITGLVVMAIEDDDKAVFVNIVGETDWRSISKIGRKFNVDELEDLDEKDSPRQRRK
ncbi:MAG: DUF4252 domain-containing protein [bacterium]|nr:MAG: DUF4252 domain-containing protein [bacterium]